jgi:hypothetical protein
MLVSVPARLPSLGRVGVQDPYVNPEGAVVTLPIRTGRVPWKAYCDMHCFVA